MSAPRGIAILGATGSIGRSTLAVIALHPERFRVAALCANASWQTVVEQARQFKPDVVVLADPQA
jgi:1-deoxy-D-xylulose-5-phosphate reductoisomerase